MMDDKEYFSEESASSNEEEVTTEKLFCKKKKAAKRKRGRKCTWLEEAVTDLVDIIIENEKSKQKLLLTNTKNTKNGVYYAQVIAELKKRCGDREEDFIYDVAQKRSKFKRCVSICRKAALTIKISPGIKRFQEERFEKLYEVVYTMDNCQPEQSIEPRVVESSREEENEENDIDRSEESLESEEKENDVQNSDGSSLIKESTPISKNGKRRKVFVPEIPTEKQSKKHLVESTIHDLSKTLGTLTDAIKDNSSTKQLVQYLRKDAERQERQDRMFMTMMQGFMMGQSPMTNPVPQQFGNLGMPNHYQYHPQEAYNIHGSSNSTSSVSNAREGDESTDYVLDRVLQNMLQ